MAAIEISGHSQVFQHVMSSFERTNDFIEENQHRKDKQDEIKEKIMQDLCSTLVLVLDNMGRQRAIQALEVYREHEKFRKSLEDMQEDSINGAASSSKQKSPKKSNNLLNNFQFNTNQKINDDEEEKKDSTVLTPRRMLKRGGNKRSSQNIIASDITEQVLEKKVEKAAKKAPVKEWSICNGLFKEAFEEIVEEAVSLSHYVTNCYRMYKQTATMTDHKIQELTKNFTEVV